ncbi:hypothetical protein XENTR_v10002646 [Xenopus tropicalis]|nr:hypothetical protein XENTR_v10002646 [Xenopus tropicalis]
MADACWDGWEEKYTPAGVSGGATGEVPVTEIGQRYIWRSTFGTKPDSGKRYVWRGTFIQKSDSEGRRVMVPCCGKCNAEVTRELRDFAAKCPQCQMPCWVGPFQAVGKSKDSELRSALIFALEGLSVVIKGLE